jgi:hypothetical protein
VYFPRPVWQKGNGVPAGGQRLVPDVCATADPNEGAVLILQGKRLQILPRLDPFLEGHVRGQSLAASALKATGVDARYLEHGIAGWAEHRLPMRSKRDTEPRSWVTRERPKIDRIACPWLIRRFIDPEAEFLFAPTGRVFAVAAETGATPYDIPGAEPFSHDGELCSFDAFLKVYGVENPALDALALIVRGADTARLELTPQSPGLLAVSLGLSAIYADDHAMLERGMTVYDALYAWCRDFATRGTIGTQPP